MGLRQILESPSKTLAITLAVFCFCVFVVSLFSQDVPSIANVPSSSIRVAGTVDAEVERRIDGQRVVLNEVLYADESREGRLLVWTPLYPEISFGDRIVFNCRVQRPQPFNGFAYDTYLATKGIYAMCQNPQYIDVLASDRMSIIGVLLAIKGHALGTLRNILPEPHASFLSGLLFGGSSALSDDLKDDFRATGVTHILAASGYNVSIFSVTFLSFILSTRIRRHRGLLLTSLLLVAYVLLAGASAAVVRAGIMGGLVLLERFISRKAYLLNVFLLTASVMFLFNPLLLYDVGFQLSFVATAAIMLFTKPLSDRFDFIPDTIGLRASFAGSLAATIFTLPLILWHFGQVSIISVFANLLVLPLVPYAMAATFIALCIGVLSGPLGLFAALPSWALGNVMLTIITLFGSIPFALVEPAYARLLGVVIGVLLLGIWMYKHYDTSRS